MASKIYHYAVPVVNNSFISDAREQDYKEIASIEVFDEMTEAELDAELKDVGIPENAIVLYVTRL